jgi:hypothetical protein
MRSIAARGARGIYARAPGAEESVDVTSLIAFFLAAAVLAGLLVEPARADPKQVFIPLFVYRTGSYAVQGIPSTQTASSIN